MNKTHTPSPEILSQENHTSLENLQEVTSGKVLSIFFRDNSTIRSIQEILGIVKFSPEQLVEKTSQARINYQSYLQNKHY